MSDTLAVDDQWLQRFEREALAAASLSHPNIVQVYDYSASDACPYLVMEYVPGGSLAERLAARDELPLDPLDVSVLARGLLIALAHIHDAGIVHRDVKPANILLGLDGRPQLTDFGIARADDAAGLTQTGIVIGTLGYLAPEVQDGLPATAQSDLYAAGVVLRAVSADHAGSVAALIDALTASAPGRRPDVPAALQLLDGPPVPTVVAPTPAPPTDLATPAAAPTPPAPAAVDTAPAPAAVDTAAAPAAVDTAAAPAAVDTAAAPAAVDTAPAPAAVDTAPAPAAVDTAPALAAVAAPELEVTAQTPAAPTKAVPSAAPANAARAAAPANAAREIAGQTTPANAASAHRRLSPRLVLAGLALLIVVVVLASAGGRGSFHPTGPTAGSTALPVPAPTAPLQQQLQALDHVVDTASGH